MMRAALLFALGALAAACGSIPSSSDAGDHPGPDGMVPPGDPDAGDPPVEVTVHAWSHGEPMRGAEVVFHDAQGLVLGVIETTDDGAAAFAVPPGGMVTLLSVTNGGEYLARTFAGVAPGDVIHIGSRTPMAAPSTAAMITLPGSVMAATAYRVSTGCEEVTVASATVTPTLEVGPACTSFDGSTTWMTVIATATDAWDTPYAYSAMRVPVQATPPPLPAWQTEFQSMMVTAGPMPPGATQASVQLKLDTGFWFGMPPASGMVGEGSSLTANPWFPVDFADRMRLETAIFVAPDAVLASLHQGPIEGQFVIGPAELLPQIQDVGLGACDTSRPCVWWGAPAELAGADLLMATVRWGVNEERHIWQIYLPPDTNAPFQVPALSEDVAPWRPDIELGGFDPPSIVAADVSIIGGWDDFRRSWSNLFDDEMPRDDLDARMSFAGGGF